MSNQPGPSESKPTGSLSTTSKAISSLAKKQDDVTRQGTQKLKFVPTLPVRRRKNEEVKQEEAPVTIPSTSGLGRGRGRGRGRGEGRGGAPSGRPPVEMVASGPFALGPAMGGTAGRRVAPRSNFAPIVPLGSGNSSSLGAGLTKATGPSLKTERVKESEPMVAVKDDDAYSDPDEGVEIVDMDDVRRMDWMAPESLRKEKVGDKKKKKDSNLKKEEGQPAKGKAKGGYTSVSDAMDEDDTTEAEQVDLANALDLSDSEEEEEMEDLIDDFALQEQTEEDSDVRAERLYFFQFPEPFPTFFSPRHQTSEAAPVPGGDSKGKGKEQDDQGKGKKVTFADDVKAASVTPGVTPGPENINKEDSKVDGIIGRLEIYQSGAVKMRLANGILLDVTAATQPSFLQHAVYLDMENKRLNVLGEVNRRFVVSPNVDTLLEKLDDADRQSSIDSTKLADGLLKLDMT